jgi:hypothetical protein
MADSMIQILEGLHAFGGRQTSPLMAMGDLQATESPRAEEAFLAGSVSPKTLLIVLAGAAVFMWMRKRQGPGLYGFSGAPLASTRKRRRRRRSKR